MLPWLFMVGSGRMGFDWTHPSDCNVYLLDGGGGRLCMVDAGTGMAADEVFRHVEEEGFTPAGVEYVLLTHLHADHAGGAAAIRRESGARVAACAGGAAALENADEDAVELTRARACGFYPPDYRLEPCAVDIRISDGDVLECGDLRITARVLPGHSAWDVYYFVEKDGYAALFSGDGFFFDGRISLLNTYDADLKGLARAASILSSERVDGLFPGHLQPALRNGAAHLKKAAATFERLLVPPGIV